MSNDYNKYNISIGSCDILFVLTINNSSFKIKFNILTGKILKNI